MATYKIGKLKFSISKAGFAFRWGEGEVQRFPFGLKSDQDIDVADGLDPYSDGGEDAYYDDEASGDYDRYADREYDDGAADGYAEDGYDDGGYAREDYPEDDYAEDGYAPDDYSDADYGDEYAREQYDEDGYAGDGGYYDENGEYIEGQEPGSFMQYIDENDWVTYVLLVLLPPLGIYLLWRRGRFDTLVRAGISAASALWFVAIIWIVVSLIAGGVSDEDIVNPGMTILPPTTAPVTSVAPSVSPAASTLPSTTGGILDDDGIEPTATPINGGQDISGAATSEFVWAPTTGLYYHNSNTCSALGGATANYISLELAQRRGLSQCPTCYNAQTYYMTTNGRWYHTDSDCQGMVNAIEVTAQQAVNAGKTACPVCNGGTDSGSSFDQSSSGSASALLSYLRSLSTDRSGIQVYATKNGTYFHTESDCSDMRNASSISLLLALQSGKTPCPECCSVGRRTVYCTQNGSYFHTTSTCSGMSGARAVNVAIALALGKDPCPTCLSGFRISTGGSGSGGDAASGEDDGTVYVYATSNGRYYHVQSNCQGMTGAQRVPLRTMLAAGRPACPECCPYASRTVYATRGGQYYHSYATCSGMSGATSGTLAQALAYGYERCPNCWSSSSSGSSGSSSDADGDTDSDSGSQSVSGVTVYCTQNGNYYHTNRTCSGMTGARAVTLEAAVEHGKTACPTCASIASRTVYAVSGGRYFHSRNTCTVESLSSARTGTVAQALMSGFAPCPTCVRGTASSGGTAVEATYTPGTSGIRVYASQDGRYYHLTRSCAGSEASYVTLETALNYGKTACPTCARSTAERTVYAVRGSDTFHLYRQHAGSGAASGTAATALATGMKYCSVCQAVAQTGGSLPTSSDTFNSGASGIRVYATIGGTYFHTSQAHAGSGASRVTLETAINYGKRPCPDCASIAYRTVYATADSKYYHASKSCAGSEATAGYLAIALAMGKEACPVCVNGNYGGDDDSGGSGGSGSGGTISETTAVYIDLQGDSDASLFHSASTCRQAGMASGSRVTVEFVRDQGFSPCPYCW